MTPHHSALPPYWLNVFSHLLLVLCSWECRCVVLKGKAAVHLCGTQCPIVSHSEVPTCQLPSLGISVSRAWRLFVRCNHPCVYLVMRSLSLSGFLTVLFPSVSVYSWECLDLGGCTRSSPVLSPSCWWLLSVVNLTGVELKSKPMGGAMRDFS